MKAVASIRGVSSTRWRRFRSDRVGPRVGPKSLGDVHVRNELCHPDSGYCPKGESCGGCREAREATSNVDDDDDDDAVSPFRVSAARVLLDAYTRLLQSPTFCACRLLCLCESLVDLARTFPRLRPHDRRHQPRLISLSSPLYARPGSHRNSYEVVEEVTGPYTRPRRGSEPSR